MALRKSAPRKIGDKHLAIVKKRTKKFVRFQSNRFLRVKPSWRKPKGIDCRVRRRFRGCNRMPKIGYGSDKRTKHSLPNGKKKFVVQNMGDLELLMMHNEIYCAQIAHGVSAKKREALVQRADELRVKVLNRDSKIRQEENE
eukprot:GHVN01077618.1.p2 GENE.GHVN01077618.1~~GHVN01077618.1.p2  ORF type:complete len:142 (+),score=11.63 GHVN01077618.1:52-477(+)